LVVCLSVACIAQDSDTTFKVNVKLVNVFVTVTDQHGAPIADLKKDNFQLREDDKEQKIAVFDKESALPLSIVLAIDTSLSMSKVDYKEAVRAAQQAEAILYSIIVVPIEASAGRDTGGEHALIQLSEDTGGKYFYASSMPQLDEAFRQISDELRTQYLLAYY